MKVKELKEILSKIDDETIVVISSDSEGNSYSPLSSYSPDYNYSDGEIGLKKLTDDDKSKGYTEEDLKEGQSAFVLWP